jgi:hypothetical protein
MIEHEQYTPGPASGARVQKGRVQDENMWTLILACELRHSPEKVWQRAIDPWRSWRSGPPL